MDWILEKILRYPKQSIAVITAVVIVCASAAWWLFFWQNPQQVFEGMLANSLSTTSVTKQATAGDANQSVSQNVRLQMGSTNAANWLVLAKQNGSTVETESVGTPTTGYIRYTQISTAPAKGSKAYSFNSVLNIWAKSDGKTDTALTGLFSQTLIDVASAPLPPIGNLPVDQRDNILAYIHNEQVFTPNYKTVKRETLNGRRVYTYQVSVKLGAYVRMMQAFAHDLGLTNLDTVDPNQYSTLPPLSMTLSVDVLSHELTRATFAGSGFTQTYRDWGVLTPITIPRATITTTELQNKLQALSAQAHV